MVIIMAELRNTKDGDRGKYCSMMAMSMKENGKMIKDMGMVNISGLMAPNMKVNSKMA